MVGTFKGVSAREQQTAKMAEGPDPGKTSAKCKLVSALLVMYAQQNVSEHFYITMSTCML